MKNLFKYFIIASIILTSIPACAVIEIMDSIEKHTPNVQFPSLSISPVIDKVKSCINKAKGWITQTQPKQVAPANIIPKPSATTFEIIKEALKSPWVKGGIAVWLAATIIVGYVIRKDEKEHEMKYVPDNKIWHETWQARTAMVSFGWAALTALGAFSLKKLLNK
jgi:hypothetical protein